MRKLHSLISLALISAATMSVSARMLPRNMAQTKAPQEKFAPTTRLNTPARANSALKADFTIDGADALAPVYSDNFDSGIGAWLAEPSGSAIEWSTKRIAAAGEPKSFSAIDPDDVASLYVEGPYQTFKRGVSTLTSGTVRVPERASLSMYVGYSLNYNDMASLVLSVSEDDFETEVTLWNSLEQQGDRVWAWRYVSADLSAFEGKEVKLRFTYGAGTGDSFGTGGYMADFAIDGLAVSGLKSVESVDVMTGEAITLADMSEGNPVAWKWTLPGAVPSTSTETSPSVYYTADGIYDISLEVTDADGNTASRTRTAFVNVTGTAPVAKIVPPATFRSSANRKYLVAPMVPVRFSDGSAGFPSEHSWAFTHTVDGDPDAVSFSNEANPEVAYPYLHDHLATLSVSNSHGSSDDMCEVTAEYSGVVTNLRPEDTMTTFDMDDWGIFPGSNTRKITAYAERFSAPSRPVMIDGAYVFFNRADAEEITDQIANVGVHIYTSKNGKPDKRLDSWWWFVSELDLPSASGQAVGTSFPFTEAPFVDGEFFIVVDGIPEYTETCAVSFGMAAFRDHDNTSLMLKDGEWISVADYFPAGANHTSFMIYPSVHHSVMASLADSDAPVAIGPKGGTVDYPIFSYLGYEMPVASDSEWLRATGEPNGMTVDDIHIECDALPAGTDERTGTLTLTDGASTLDIRVVQSRSSGISSIVDSVAEPTVFPSVFTDSFDVYGLNAGDSVTVFSLTGAMIWSGRASDSSLRIDASAFAPGVYVVATPTKAIKAVKK